MKNKKKAGLKISIGIISLVILIAVCLSPGLIKKIKGNINSIKVISGEEINTGVLVDTSLQYDYDNDRIILKVDNNSKENIYVDKVEYRDICNIKDKECSDFQEISITPINLNNSDYTNITISSARSKFGNDFDIEIGIKYTMGEEEYITTTNVFSPVLFDENSRNVENNDQTSEEFSFYAYDSSQWNANVYNNAKMFVKLTDNDVHMEINENLSDLGMTYYMKSDFPYRWYIENPFKESTYNAKMLGLDNYSNFRTYFDYSYPTEVKEGKASFTYDNVYFNMSGTPKQILTNETIIPTFFWIMRKCSTSICASYDYQRTSEDNTIFKSDKLPQFKLTVYNKDSLKTAIQQAQNKLLSKESLNYDNISYYNLINHIKSAKSLYSGRDYYNKCDEKGNNCIKTETTQEEINYYVTLLNNYSINKIPLADYTAYNNLLNEISVTKEEWYPADSYAEFKTIYDERTNYEGLSSSYQIKVDNYVDRLQEAFNNLNNNMYDADYTELNNVLNEAKKITNKTSYGNYELYTKESWDNYQVHLTNAKNALNYKIDRQEDVNFASTNLNAAIISLIKNDADYTEFNNIYNVVSKLIPSYYVDFAKMQTAIDAAKSLSKDLKIDKQNEIDAVTAALKEANSKLVMKDADYTEFNDIYNVVSKYIPEYYLDFTEMQTAIDAAKSLSKDLKIDKQNEIDAVTADLKEANSKLVMKDADYTEFNNIYNVVSKLIPSYYVDFAKMQTAIDAAKSLSKDLKIDKQNEIDAVTAALKEANSKLVMKDADYSKINSLKSIIEKLDENKYTNFNVVKDALKTLVYGKKVNEQDEVDKMYNDLKTAYDNLKKTRANYSELEKAIENAKKYEQNKYNYTNYSVVEELINSVNYDLTWADQDKLDELTKKINDAVSNLNKKLANYSELSKVLSLIPNDYSSYDKDLQNEIKLLLDEARALSNNLKYDEQLVIDTLVNKLRMLLEKLPPMSINDDSNTSVLNYIKVNGDMIDISQSPFKYTVSYDTKEAKISVGLVSSDSTSKIYGGKVLVPGENNITIIVTTKEGKDYTYSLVITRLMISNYLSELSIKDTEFEFNKTKQEYTIKVSKNTNKLDVSAIAEDGNAKITVKGNKNIKNGSKVIIEVEATDGSVRIYTLNIQKPSSVNISTMIILIMVISVIAGVFKYLHFKRKIK